MENISPGSKKQLEDEANYHITQVNGDRLHNKVAGQMKLGEGSVSSGVS